MTQAPREGKGEGLKELRAEHGAPHQCLHVDYSQQAGQWMRTEQTYRDGHAQGDQRSLLTRDPIQDLLIHIGGRGEVTIQVSGIDPHNARIANYC